MTYMVRPSMQPWKMRIIFCFISRAGAQLLVGPASSMSVVQMKVRSSTRATSLGCERARKQSGLSVSFSRVKVPCLTSRSHMYWYSSADPSHVYTLSGLQSSTTSRSQVMSSVCLVRASSAAAIPSPSLIVSGRRVPRRSQNIKGRRGTSSTLATGLPAQPVERVHPPRQSASEQKYHVSGAWVCDQPSVTPGRAGILTGYRLRHCRACGRPQPAPPAQCERPGRHRTPSWGSPARTRIVDAIPEAGRRSPPASRHG